MAAKLKELNPGFDGKVTPTIENGVVTGLKFLTDNVDVSHASAGVEGAYFSRLPRQLHEEGGFRPFAAQGAYRLPH